MPLSDALLDRLKPIKLLLMDVDGTLSDGRLYYNSQWIESKTFDVRDGFGIYLAHRAGLKTGIITGRNSPIVTERARELDIGMVYQGQFDKSLILNDILQKTGLLEEHIAYVGDDLFDLPLLLRAGFSAAPKDAHQEVRQRVHFVSQFEGGRGAVREVIELLIKAQGHWEEMLQLFIPS